MPNGFQDYLLGLPKEEFDSLYQKFTAAKPEPFSGARKKTYGTMGIATPQDVQFAERAKEVAPNLLESAANTVAAFAPGSGEYISARQSTEDVAKAREAINNGDYASAAAHGLESVVNAVGSIPIAHQIMALGKGAVGVAKGLMGAEHIIPAITTYHGSPTSGIRKWDLDKPLVNSQDNRIQNVKPWSTPQQEVSSASTSISYPNVEAKSPIIFKAFKNGKIDVGPINADIGGGRYDQITDWLSKRGVENVVYDPFNRPMAHNQAAMKRLAGGKADTATVSNVLNVIPDAQSRAVTIATAHDAVRPGGKVYFSMYAAPKAGVVKGRDAYQVGKKPSEYIPEIEAIFGEGAVHRQGDLIIATKRGESDIKMLERYPELKDLDKPLVNSQGNEIKNPEKFKNWFGESKVVDKNGQPLVVYRADDFTQPEVLDKTAGVIYFGKNRESAQPFQENNARLRKDLTPNQLQNEDPYFKTNDWATPKVRGFYLSAKNLATKADLIKHRISNTTSHLTEAERDKLISLGFDGVIGNIDGLPGLQEIGVFSPTQIKSINNRGTFDPNNPNILMGAAPLAAAGLLGGKDDTARNDGTKKGNGYFGVLPMRDGSQKVATEIAIGVNLGGKEVEIPTLVPTLTPQEIDHLLRGKKPTPTIVKKAIIHAKRRIKQGLSPFASSGDFKGE